MISSVATFGADTWGSSGYDTVTLKAIPAGTPGTRLTMGEMEDMVRQAVRSTEISELVEYVLSRFGAKPHNEYSQIEAVRRGLKAGLFYVHDPRNVETLRDGRILARKMLDYFHGRGPRPLADCDDFTIVGRAQLEFIGLETKSRAVGTIAPGSFNHVYPMVRTKSGRWVGIEATVPGARPFWVPRSTTVDPMDVPALHGATLRRLGASSLVDRALDPLQRAAIVVLKETAPPTMERTFKPAVDQLKEELSYLKFALMALALAGLGATYFFIRRAKRGTA